MQDENLKSDDRLKGAHYGLLELDECVRTAKTLFESLCPEGVFYPPPDDAEAFDF